MVNLIAFPEIDHLYTVCWIFIQDLLKELKLTGSIVKHLLGQN